jgi:hypothetical protein
VHSTLGDLHIQKRTANSNANLQFWQGIVNAEYLMHLYSLFESYCGSAPKVYTRHSGKANVYFNTLTSPVFTEFNSLFYLDGVKHVPANIGELLTARSLAYWAMDDVRATIQVFIFALIPLLIRKLSYCLWHSNLISVWIVLSRNTIMSIVFTFVLALFYGALPDFGSALLPSFYKLKYKLSIWFPNFFELALYLCFFIPFFFYKFFLSFVFFSRVFYIYIVCLFFFVFLLKKKKKNKQTKYIYRKNSENKKTKHTKHL